MYSLTGGKKKKTVIRQHRREENGGVGNIYIIFFLRKGGCLRKRFMRASFLSSPRTGPSGGLECRVFALGRACVAANDLGVKGGADLAMNIIEGERQRNLQE